MNAMQRYFNFKVAFFISVLCAALCLFSGVGAARAEAVPDDPAMREFAALLPDDLTPEQRERVMRIFAGTITTPEGWATATRKMAAMSPEERRAAIAPLLSLPPEEVVRQYDAYRLTAFNTSAESDIRNLKTAEEVLMGDEWVYGATRQGGALPGSGGGRGELLTGPLNAATEDTDGAMVSGVRKDGKKVGIGFGVGNDVSIQATTIKAGARDIRAVETGPAGGFYAVSKHKDGNRVFFTDSETPHIFFCENDAWKGAAGIPEAVIRALESNGLPASGGTVPCAGSPEANWQAM